MDVYDTAFGGSAPLGRGARVGYVQIQCSVQAHRCFNARYKNNAKALFACFHVEHRFADVALLRALGQALNDYGEIGDSTLLSRLAPVVPLPTYTVVRVAGWNEVPVYAKRRRCRGPCAHQMPRQVGLRRERLTKEIEVLPGGSSPGYGDPAVRSPLAIARHLSLVVHFFIPEGPRRAPDRLGALVQNGQGVPADVGSIMPWVEAETDPALRFSGYIMLASAALSRHTTGAPTGRWVAEIHRLAPIVKARLDARDRVALDQTLHSLAMLQSGNYLEKSTACPSGSGGNASGAPPSRGNP